MKLWHKGLNRCTICFGMGFFRTQWDGGCEINCWSENCWENIWIWPILLKRKIFLKGKSSQMNTFLERVFWTQWDGVVKPIAEVRITERTFEFDKFFSKEKSTWKKNLLKMNLLKKYILKRKNLHLLERNFVGRNWKVTRTFLQRMKNVTQSTPPSQKKIVYLWRPPPSYLLFPKNFNR
jgi:hypothetical protein